MASIDWNTIRTEYVTSTCSYRDLCEKYDIPLRTLARKAKQEDWQQKRNEFGNTVATMRIQEVAEKQVKSFAEFVPVLEQGIVDISTQLLGKINETLQFGDAFSPRDLKSLSSMVIDIGMLLKDIKEDMNTGSASADKITVEFVKGEWDYGGPES